MPNRQRAEKVICRGGLHSSDHHLLLSEEFPGSATALINFEPGLFGGYRRLDGYEILESEQAAVGGTSGEGAVLGIVIYRNTTTGSRTVIAARKDASANSYSIYRWVPLAGWTAYTLPTTRVVTGSGIAVAKLRFAQADFGAGNVLYAVDGVNPMVIFDGTNWTNVAYHATNAPVMLTRPALVEVFEDHVFVGGDPGIPGVVAHSSPRDGELWTAAGGAAQIPCGFDVVTFKPFREDLFVFGDNGIKRIEPDAVAGAFTIKPVTANIGCIARDSVVEIGGDLLFLAPDGFRPVAGTSRIGDVELETVSRQIQSKIIDLRNNYDLSTLNAVAVRGKSQVRFFVGNGSIGVESSYGILGGLRTGGQGGVSWEWAEVFGIRASCCTSDYIGEDEYVLHGDYNGVVYRQEQGTTFNGENIVALFLTPFLDFDDTESIKNFQKLHVFLRPEGPLNLNIGVKYDWYDSNVADPADYARTLLTGLAVYGRPLSTYAATGVVYGGAEKPVIQVEQQGSGRSVRYAFVSFDDGAPFSIQGYVVQYISAGNT